MRYTNKNTICVEINKVWLSQSRDQYTCDDMKNTSQMIKIEECTTIFSLFILTLKLYFKVKKRMRCRFSESGLLLTTDNLLPDHQDLTWKNLSGEPVFRTFLIWLWGSEHLTWTNKSANNVSKVSTNYLTLFYCIQYFTNNFFFPFDYPCSLLESRSSLPPADNI